MLPGWLWPPASLLRPRLGPSAADEQAACLRGAGSQEGGDTVQNRCAHFSLLWPLLKQQRPKGRSVSLWLLTGANTVKTLQCTSPHPQEGCVSSAKELTQKQCVRLGVRVGDGVRVAESGTCTVSALSR